MDARNDAWRCSPSGGNNLLDPCFSSSLPRNYVLCPRTPWAHRAVRLDLVKTLPYKYADQGSPGDAAPWGIKTTSGLDCVFAGGASSSVGGAPL